MKRTYEQQSDIPTGMEDLYVEADGVWTFTGFEDGGGSGGSLPFGGAKGGHDAATAARLEEFRTTNRNLTKELTSIKSDMGRIQETYRDITPEMVSEMQKQLKKSDDDAVSKLLAEGKFEEAVQMRVAQSQSNLREELDQRERSYGELESRFSDVKGRLSKRLVRDEFHSLLDSKGLRVRPGAKDDLDLRIMKDWQIGDDEKLTPVNLFGESGGPITPAEYVTRELLDQRSFYFVPAEGGGAKGGDGETPKDGVMRINADDAAGRAKYNDLIASGKAIVVN